MSLAYDSRLVPLRMYLNKLHPVPLCRTRAELHEWCTYETAVETQSPSQQTEPACDNTLPTGKTEKETIKVTESEIKSLK